MATKNKEFEFTAKIQNIGNGSRYQLTIPKKDVDAGLIDTKRTFRVILMPIKGDQ
jgi:hypothetical protein